VQPTPAPAGEITSGMMNLPLALADITEYRKSNLSLICGSSGIVAGQVKSKASIF
jgi:hypothetical protein